MSNTTNKNHNSAGKGSSPRNCFSREFKNNYDEINWGRTPKPLTVENIKGFDNNTIYCFNCGGHINKEKLIETPNLYILYADGECSCRECNFNW